MPGPLEVTLTLEKIGRILFEPSVNMNQLTILANWLFGSVSVSVREVFKKSKLTKAQ